MTPANRIEITLSDDKLASLDAARQHEPRASFIKRAIDAQVRAALSSSETPEYEPDIQTMTPQPWMAVSSREHTPTCKCPVCRPAKAQRKGGKG